MSSKKFSIYNLILILIIVSCLILLILQNFNGTGNSIFYFTGYATEYSTTSNVSIQKYLSIALCSNLSEGISFGSVSTLPATDINGTHNYDGTSTETTYCINVSSDGNTPIDFCTKANADLASDALDVILLGNESYANATSTNVTIPTLTSQVALTTTYVKAGNNISVGGINYYRFWLDIPAAQPSGDYNNSVYFKGVQTTLECGS